MNRYQLELCLLIRRAQRRIATQKLWGLAWCEPGEVDRLNRRIAALILEG